MAKHAVVESARQSRRRLRRDDPQRKRTPREGAVQQQSLKEQAQSTHEEARMVLPGIQALFGFQLIAVFNRPFSDLDQVDRYLHLASLVLVAIAIGLIMAPAAYHRLTESTLVTRRWIELASKQIARAMVALMLAISLDVYLVAVMIAGNASLAEAIGLLTGCFLASLWFVLPLARMRESRADTDSPVAHRSRIAE
jgi:uncharacterized protein DUF6328